MRFTAANVVTVARIFLAPIFLVAVLSDTAWIITVGVATFMVAAWTDWLDGYLARRFSEVSELGMFLDPLADKVLTTMAFIALYLLDVMPLYLLIVMTVRDFGTTAMRAMAEDKGTPMPTTRAAKLKTLLQMLVISWVLVLYWGARTWVDDGAQRAAMQLLRSPVTDVALNILGALAVYTLVDYVRSNRSLFSR